MDKKIKDKIKEIRANYIINKNDKNMHFKILSEIVQLRIGKIKEGEQYINDTYKITFIDRLGNEFKMTPGHVKQGKWSPYEYGNVTDSEYHIKQLEEIAFSKGGKIKEGEKYINNKTKITFIDKLGNEFKMAASNVKCGKWCPYESRNIYNNPEYHIQELNEIILSKGGKIKEGEIYINNKTKMIFIDQLGNEFKMTPSAIKSGKWSPYEKNCSEHICRQIIEQLYQKEFSSSWNVIKRKGKRTLQLDGYNSDLKIAFEYQGMQHTTGWFHKDNNKQQESLRKIQQRDEEKKQICIDNNILLLEINYYKNTNNIKEIINQTIDDIKKSYEINNREIPDFINNIPINKIKIDLAKISHLVLMQKQLEEIVLSKDGKIKEGQYYINSKTKMTFIDKSGNEFKMAPSAVNSGQWSPYEAGNIRNKEYHIKQLEEIAFSKGGKIKEGEIYINNKTKMTFIDKLDNEFKMTPNAIKSGRWSPYESGSVTDSEYHMKELNDIVVSKGGKIKEGEIYINNKTKMTFIDKLGNEFKMTPNNLKRGHWIREKSKTVCNVVEEAIKTPTQKRKL